MTPATLSHPTRARSTTSGITLPPRLEIKPGHTVGFDTRDTADLHYTPGDRGRHKAARCSIIDDLGMRKLTHTAAEDLLLPALGGLHSQAAPE